MKRTILIDRETLERMDLMNYVTLNSGIGGFLRGVEKVAPNARSLATVEEDMQAYRTYNLINETSKERMLPTVEPLRVIDFGKEGVDVIYGDLTRQYMYFDPENKRKPLKLTPRVIEEWVSLNNPKSIVLFMQVEDAEVNREELLRFSQSLSDKGYSISFDVVYSYYLGVAQHRKDLVYVAVKDMYVENKPLASSNRDKEVDSLKVRLNDIEKVSTFEFDFPSLLTQTKQNRLVELNRIIGLLDRDIPLTSLLEEEEKMDLKDAEKERQEILSTNNQSVGVLLQDVLEEEVDEFYLVSPERVNTPYEIEGLSPHLKRVNEGVSPHQITLKERLAGGGRARMKVRHLTPLEYWRLQGYTDADYHRMEQERLSRQTLYNISLLTVIPQTVAAVTSNLLKVIKNDE